jgi:hypothetical protein
MLQRKSAWRDAPVKNGEEMTDEDRSAHNTPPTSAGDQDAQDFTPIDLKKHARLIILPRFYQFPLPAGRENSRPTSSPSPRSRSRRSVTPSTFLIEPHLLGAHLPKNSTNQKHRLGYHLGEMKTIRHSQQEEDLYEVGELGVAESSWRPKLQCLCSVRVSAQTFR